MAQKPRKFNRVKINTIENSYLKRMVRASVMDSILETHSGKQLIRGFTLPASQFMLEQMLLEHYGNRIQFVCVENNKDVFQEGKTISKPLIRKYGTKIDLYNTMDLKYWKEHPADKFDFIWLDYCGPYSKTKLESLELIFKNKNFDISNGKTPVMGLTVMNGMDFYGIKDLLVLSSRGVKDKNYFKVRMEGIPKLINNIANKNGMSIYPKFIFSYRDKVRSKLAVPMLLFIFDIKEGIHEDNIWNTQYINLLADIEMGNL